MIAALLIAAAAVPATGFAQTRGHAHAHYKKEKQQSARYNTTNAYYGYSYRNAPPVLAPLKGSRTTHHVHFPDYHVFYDPYRSGYAYWQDNHWMFSQSTPTFLSKVNIGRSRIQFLGDVPLTTHPEDYYDRHVEMYPVNKKNIAIPIPGR